MAKVPYKKPFLSYAAQLQQLKQRGLSVVNDQKALHLLESISYYRLSGYWYPFLSIPKANHHFKPGSTFDLAFNLYCFDRELRHLVMNEIEKIEVAVRAKMIHILADTRGAFWHIDNSLFSDVTQLSRAITKLDSEYKRSDEQFIKAFNLKYSNVLPPCWMILEISSFGNLSHLYKNLKPSPEKRAIAKHFGLDESTFESWLHSIVYARNVCAHHSRLWNREMSIRAAVPRKTIHTWLNTTTITNNAGGNFPINNRPYFLLSMIVYLLNIINPKHTFKTKFKALLNKYPNVDTGAMGAPANWVNEPLWM